VEIQDRLTLRLQHVADTARNQPRHAAGSPAAIDSCLVFTVAQRDALREHLLRLAKQDPRVVAAILPARRAARLDVLAAIATE
jgi:flagellar biosynthesis/type III secretory pathway M-ring protein FliF/YscJ